MTTRRVASVWHEAGEQTPTEYVEGALYRLVAVDVDRDYDDWTGTICRFESPHFVANRRLHHRLVDRAERIWTYDPDTQVVIDKTDFFEHGPNALDHYAASFKDHLTARTLIRAVARALRAQEAQS